MDGPASAILRAFAELAPAGQRVGVDVTAGGQPLAWLGLHTTLVELWSHQQLIGERMIPDSDPLPPARIRRTRESDRLAAIDALHEHERLLREGWIYLAGTTVLDGDSRRVCHPLLSRPVMLRRAVDCCVPPGGVMAHLARRRALWRAGWRVTEAWASRYDHDPVRAALELATRTGALDASGSAIATAARLCAGGDTGGPVDGHDRRLLETISGQRRRILAVCMAAT